MYQIKFVDYIIQTCISFVYFFFPVFYSDSDRGLENLPLKIFP